MKKLLILSVIFLAFAAQAQQAPDSVYLERLQEMSDADQNARKMLNSELNNDSAWQVIHAVDAANLIELKQLIAERGFPTLSKVGYKCCNLASLIAQHQPPEFLHWYLEQAKAAADTGDFDLIWIAYMTDRDLNYQGKPQLYGTQLHDQDGITALRCPFAATVLQTQAYHGNSRDFLAGM